METSELTKDEILYLIRSIRANEFPMSEEGQKLIDKLRELVKPEIPKHLICIINSIEQAELVFKLNEVEGLTDKGKMYERGVYNINEFNYSYCYIGFHRGYWQTIERSQIADNYKLVTFEQLKSMIN